MSRIRRAPRVVVEEVIEEEEFDENEIAENAGDMDRIEAKYRERATSPLRAVRAFCVLCMGCQPRMVAKCSATGCTLYPFRFGKNPFQSGSNRKKRGDDE